VFPFESAHRRVEVFAPDAGADTATVDNAEITWGL
jgi:hypothetical protein